MRQGEEIVDQTKRRDYRFILSGIKNTSLTSEYQIKIWLLFVIYGHIISTAGFGLNGTHTPPHAARTHRAVDQWVGGVEEKPEGGGGKRRQQRYD